MLVLTFLLQGYNTYDCIWGVFKDEMALGMALFRSWGEETQPILTQS